MENWTDWYPSRFFRIAVKTIQEAVSEKLNRMRHSRLARECAKLDPEAEKAMAEEGLAEDVKNWHTY